MRIFHQGYNRADAADRGLASDRELPFLDMVTCRNCGPEAFHHVPTGSMLGESIFRGAGGSLLRGFD